MSTPTETEPDELPAELTLGEPLDPPLTPGELADAIPVWERTLELRWNGPVLEQAWESDVGDVQWRAVPQASESA